MTEQTVFIVGTEAALNDISMVFADPADADTYVRSLERGENPDDPLFKAIPVVVTPSSTPVPTLDPNQVDDQYAELRRQVQQDLDANAKAVAKSGLARPVTMAELMANAQPTPQGVCGTCLHTGPPAEYTDPDGTVRPTDGQCGQWCLTRDAPST